MKKVLSVFVCILFFVACSVGNKDKSSSKNEADFMNWRSDIERTLKLFGHRNWIVIADAAYPQQSHAGIRTITVDAHQLDVVEYVCQLIDDAAHVDANLLLDKEMAFVTEENAKGIESYRCSLEEILEGKNVTSMMHEDIIDVLDSSAELFNVFIIKTNLTLPYSSVFFRLECGYWDDTAEKILRNTLSEN